MTKPFPVRSLVLNVVTIFAGLLAMVGIFYGAAALSIDGPAQRLAEAFDDGTLSNDVARELAPVTGLVVFESDYEGACSAYSHMLSPAQDLFGLGIRPSDAIWGCEAVNATVHGRLGEAYSPYYRLLGGEKVRI